MFLFGFLKLFCFVAAMTGFESRINSSRTAKLSLISGSFAVLCTSFREAGLNINIQSVAGQI